MSGVSICTCGHGGECPGTCAGALAQQLECAENGHLTPRSVHLLAWRAEPLGLGEYCYRCGAEGE